MQIKRPNDDQRISWTDHSSYKMQQYGLSAQRVRRVLKNPKRKEEGIIPGTVAVMQIANPTAKNRHEIWVMYKVIEETKGKELLKKKFAKMLRPTRHIKIITCWRYPGESPVRQPPPIPDDILSEIHLLL